MSLDTLFNGQCVAHDLRVSGKKQLLKEMISLARNCPRVKEAGLDERELLSAVMERERLGTTGIGSGVAIPHARVKGLTQMSAAFARLGTEIDYDAVDDRPVDLVVMLLAPENAGAEHLRALAQVSRLLRREETRARLRAAPSAEALHVMLTDTSRSSAA
jgi:PTS system nitrogen regulatory IIA component